MWSTCWKTARTAQGLYSAYLVTGKPAHLAAANLDMEYMAIYYDKKTSPMDYVDLRITSYALIALAKIAATRPEQWGCSYSGFGC